MRTLDLSDISEQVESLQPKSVIVGREGGVLGQLLRGQLREYQEVALDWLVAMDKVKKHLPAVLGDVSGLDRRVTTAALFAHLAAERGDWGSPLLVAPLSALDSWKGVFRAWCPALRVTVYPGGWRDRRRLRHDIANDIASGNAPNVVLTSYRLLFLV